MTSDKVFVVRRDDGLWDASCHDERCGTGLHGIGPGDGVYDTETGANRAAAAHRRTLANQPLPPGVPTEHCPTCGQRATGRLLAKEQQ
ncbi:hypothetical protein ACQEU3_47020 [Spirillospora sp. CA-253888]